MVNYWTRKVQEAFMQVCTALPCHIASNAKAYLELARKIVGLLGLGELAWLVRSFT